MTAREQYLAIARHEQIRPGMILGSGYWPETLERWKEQGMPDGHDFGYTRHRAEIPINSGMLPAFKIEVIEDEGETQIVRDQYGVIKRCYRDRPGSLQQFLQHPVHDKPSWDAIKSRLDPDNPGRLPQPTDLAQEQDSELLYAFGAGGHLGGFFSFIRELCGDDCYYLMYDNPSLIEEMVEFQTFRIRRLLERAVEHYRVDQLSIWEDMCYNHGPLISPQQFRDFFLNGYKTVCEYARGVGIEVIDVDSDGDIRELIPLWLEAGVTMLHPMEVASHCDVNEIGKEYGRSLAMHGGVDKRELSKGRDEIDAEVERILPAFERGGYIPHVDHWVPPEVSFENYTYYLSTLRAAIG